MLVLSRKRNERIVISGPAIVTLVEICGHKVRLGIVAPRDVSVVREELLGDGERCERLRELHASLAPSNRPAA